MGVPLTGPLLLGENAADPAAPAAGEGALLYVKGGQVYSRAPGGAPVPLGSAAGVAKAGDTMTGKLTLPEWQIPTIGGSAAQVRAFSAAAGGFYQTVNLDLVNGLWVLDDNTKSGYIWLSLNGSGGWPMIVYKGVSDGAGGVTLTVMLSISDAGVVNFSGGRVSSVGNAVNDNDAMPFGQADGRYGLPLMMAAGLPCPFLRRVGPVAITSTNTGAMTPVLPAIAAGRKAVLKNIVITNPTDTGTLVWLAADATYTGQFVYAMPVGPRQTLPLDVGTTLVAGQGLFASISSAAIHAAGGVNISVTYADLPDTAAPQQYSWVTGLQGNAAATTLIVPAAPVIASSILLGNVSAIDAIVRIGLIGFGSWADVRVPASSIQHIDSPVYLPVGTNLNAQNLVTDVNCWVSCTISGYAATS